MRSLPLLVALAFAVAPLPAAAAKPGPTVWDECFARAGAYYSINPLLLKAIARQESSMNPAAIGKNTNGTIDIGLMQINTWHLPRLSKAGVSRESLKEPCTNIAVGAWVLADAISRHGMSWKAVGVYHSPTAWRQEAYAAKVQKHLVREIQAAQTIPGAVAAVSSAGYATGGAP